MPIRQLPNHIVEQNSFNAVPSAPTLVDTVPTHSIIVNHQPSTTKQKTKWSFVHWMIWFIGLVVIAVIFIALGYVADFIYHEVVFNGEPLPAISIGQRARGIIAIGQFSVGVLAIGQIAVGIVTIGQITFGVINLVSMVGAGLLFGIGIISVGYGLSVGIVAVGSFVPAGIIGLALFLANKCIMGISLLVPAFFKDKKVFRFVCT